MKRGAREALAAAGIGAVAGMRSLFAPALVAHALAHDGARGRGTAARALSTDRTATMLEILAAGEMMADKTPWVPDRVRPLPLVGRALSGAVAGAAVASRRRSARGRLAAIGAGVAVASALVMFGLRRDATRGRGLPGAVAGLAEDAVAATLGAAVVVWLRRR